MKLSVSFPTQYMLLVILDKRLVISRVTYYVWSKINLIYLLQGTTDPITLSFVQVGQSVS